MKKKFFISLGILAAIVGSRVLPHPVNFAPVSALFLLFPGYSLIIMASLFVSDLFLGFHSTLVYVYASYALIALLGLYGRRLKESFSFFTLPLLSSMLFYVITNFGVWATTSMYTHNFTGLMQSYWMGIPFLRGTIGGDIFFFSVIYILSLLHRQESRQHILQYVKAGRPSFFA